MRKLRTWASAIAALLITSTIAWAVNTQLSNLSASGAIAGANLLYVVQTAGSGGVKATFTQVATFINSLFSGDCTATSGGALTCTKFNGGTAFASAAGAASGSSGHTLPFLDGTNTFSGTQTFGSVVGAINIQVGTTYTLAATDCGKTVLITNASAITLTTLNSIPAGCAISVEQGGAGQITVANGAGATLTSAHSFTKTFNAVGAIIGLFVDTNSGAAAHFVLTGDGA